MKTPALTILMVLLMTFGVSVSPPATAEEYFGEFPDILKGVFDHTAKPRPLFKLSDDYRFIDPNGVLWTTPQGTEVDGASIPQVFWSYIGGPFEGEYLSASVIHDHYCRTRTHTAHDTHRNFYYGMRAAGVPEWKASFMYWVVNTFGPSWKIEKRIRMAHNCQALPSGDVECQSVPVIQEEVVTLPAADLSDPEVLAVAIGKANAIAKNLLTSEGKTLERLNDQEIVANVQNIEKSSQSYRDLFVKKDFQHSAAQIGILAETPHNGPLYLEPWEGHTLPAPKDAALLTPGVVAEHPGSRGFILKGNNEELIKHKVNLESIGSKSILKKEPAMQWR
ncbi:DUF1353 domain-containing protein [Pseudomonas sp. NY15372]|uniref:DUF1353 domain-containing protein n=1 Tax=Pseudomonas sp. NY15372 TaxID=3400356 RepID=UPI003A85EA8D